MTHIHKKILPFLIMLPLFAGCATVKDKTRDLLYDPVKNEQGEVTGLEPNATGKMLEEGAGLLPVPYADTVVGALLTVGAGAFGTGRKGKTKKKKTGQAFAKAIEEIKNSDLGEDAEEKVKKLVQKKAKEYGVEDEVAKLFS